jgi:hypothetical protein
MTKEEYISKLEELENAKVDLRREYIESNKPYPIGSKVKVTYKVGYEPVIGIVDSYKISGWDIVIPVLHKVKKDGTKHATAELYIPWWNVKEIEVINN